MCVHSGRQKRKDTSQKRATQGATKIRLLVDLTCTYLGTWDGCAAACHGFGIERTRALGINTHHPLLTLRLCCWWHSFCQSLEQEGREAEEERVRVELRLIRTNKTNVLEHQKKKK